MVELYEWLEGLKPKPPFESSEEEAALFIITAVQNKMKELGYA